MYVSGRWLLGGPSAERLISKCSRAWRKKGQSMNPADQVKWSHRMKLFLEECRAESAAIPRFRGDVSGLDFVIEAKNLKNYFHFTKEVLISLTMVEEITDFNGRIVIVYEKNEPAPFVMRFIEFLFPELASLVVFKKAPYKTDRALITWYGDYTFLQRYDGTGYIWDNSHLFSKKIDSSVYKVLRRNGYSRALKKLRDRAHSKTKHLDFSHLPKRVWISRNPKMSRERSVTNERKLIDSLLQREFDVLYFEDLDPASQIGLMSRAEIVATFHGAGIANMLYASRNTKILEIGTLQSGLQRQSDFVAFAHCSHAHYTTVVADFEYEGLETIPPLRRCGLYPVRISDLGISKLLSYVEEL